MFSELRQSGLTNDQEEGCRQFYLQTDIKQARVGMLLFAIPLLSFILNDFQFLKFPVPLYSIIALRVGLLFGCLLEFIHIDKVKSYRSYDRLVSLGAIALLIGSGFINATRPPSFVAQAVIAIICIFIVYIVIPNRFLYQFLLALIITLGEAFIIVIPLHESNVSILFTIFISLVFANAIAMLSSWQMHTYRRRSYIDHVKRKELQDKLEQHSKDLENLVAERTEKLKNAERLAAIGATAGMVGHDIRNPLTAITGAVYLAKKELMTFPEGETKDKLKNNIDLIADQTIYVNKIVEDLQDYARPLHPAMEETNLEQMLQSILSELRIPENITVVCLINEDHPKLKTDSSYVKRILTNLISNAVQAMPNGGNLTIKVAVENDKTQIIVEDTGEGIPEEAKSKLFTPLITTKSKGQGFGLAVVKRLTEALSGTVTFESEFGKGTKFVIELPLIS